MNAVVGSPIGAAIIFAQTNNINSLNQLKNIYCTDAPNRPVNVRQVLRLADQGKTFVVQEEKEDSMSQVAFLFFFLVAHFVAQFPLQCTASGIVDGESQIPYAFTIHSQKENGGGYPVSVFSFLVLSTSNHIQIDSSLILIGYCC